MSNISLDMLTSAWQYRIVQQAFQVAPGPIYQGQAPICDPKYRAFIRKQASVVSGYGGCVCCHTPGGSQTMTVLVKPVVRQSACQDRGVPLIVTLHPRHLEVRPKGTRQRYTLGYDAILWQAVKRAVDERRREKSQARKGRRA
jgi:hypothetical protein